MGLFDIIFKKKREQERLERERAEAAERAAAERRRREAAEREAAEQRRLEQERLERERKAAEKKEAERKKKEEAAKAAAQTTSPIKRDVDDIISTFEARDTSSLQMKLFNLCNKFNKAGGGQLIVSFPEKDRLCEVFCLCLEYDWMNDKDIREAWAENGFYCIAEYFKSVKTQQDYFAAALALFLLCAYGKNSLYTKFDDILNKTAMHPFHFSVFSAENYNGGASHLVREFMFFAATIVSPVARTHPEVISPSMRNEFERAKTDFAFASVSPEDIMNKMGHISRIIGSILESY